MTTRNKRLKQHETHDGIDFLRETGGGVYCITPFYNKDTKGNTMFKVGVATDFQKRMGHYHTTFINGIAYIALLKINSRKKEPTGKYDKQIWRSNYTDVLNEAEKLIMAELKAPGLPTSVVLLNKLRTWRGGETEWVYTSETFIHAVFERVTQQIKRKHNKAYYISLQLFPLDFPAWRRALQGKRLFKGEIWYNLDNNDYQQA